MPSSKDLFELEKRSDGSLQVRLSTNRGFVDILFLDEWTFLSLVARQHKETALKVLEDLPH